MSWNRRGRPPKAARVEAESSREQAESANRAKSTFLANMSHEIRTPMNAILGYAQILQREAELPPNQNQALETIQKSGDHLLAMINDILDLSKIEAGRMELQPSDFDLVSLIQGLESMFQLRCDEKGLGLRVEGRGPKLEAFKEPIPVRADEGKLRQILINLLGNAVKFTERGTIQLVVSGPSSVVSSPWPVIHGNESRTESTKHLTTDNGDNGRSSVLRSLIPVPASPQRRSIDSSSPFSRGKTGSNKGARGWAWPSANGNLN